MIGVVGALLLVTTGCTASQEAPVEHVAEELQAALDQQDGAKACDLLSEDAQEELQEYLALIWGGLAYFIAIAVAHN